MSNLLKFLKTKSLPAIVLVLVLALAFAFKTPKQYDKIRQSSLYWYPVNPATNLTIGTYGYHNTKANVLSEQACDDTGTPICLFGSTNSSLPIGTNVGTPAPANRILETQQ